MLLTRSAARVIDRRNPNVARKIENP